MGRIFQELILTNQSFYFPNKPVLILNCHIIL